MSRKQRVLKKRYAIFCEGDTEYNYTDIKKKTFDISIKSTVFNQDMLNQRVSNVEEFFDVIDW